MRAVGIVCEYNPFHRGHRRQLEESRRRCGAETALVCVMSGDFVQRGEAALFDKFTRAEAACRGGADLVAELPLPWCLSSAEGFAAGGTAALAALGCGFLSFGSESGDLPALTRLADFLTLPDTLPRILERMERESALSFARAREQLAEEALGADAVLLSSPNDILAVEYLRAIRTQGLALEPLAVRRVGGGHDSLAEGEYPSAMALRVRIERGLGTEGQIPAAAAAVLDAARRAGRMRNPARLEIALLSRLYTLGAADFERLPDGGGGAGRRLYRAVRQGGSLEEMAAAASCKRFTAARMRRMLLCATLGLRAGDAAGSPPYLRILAANGRGREYLRSLKPALPLLTRPAEIRKAGERAQRCFELGAAAHDLYRLQYAPDGGKTRDADWKTPVLLVQN